MWERTNDLVYFLRYIPCVEIFDVYRRSIWWGKKPTHGARNPSLTICKITFLYSNIVSYIAYNRDICTTTIFVLAYCIILLYQFPEAIVHSPTLVRKIFIITKLKLY